MFSFKAMLLIILALFNFWGITQKLPKKNFTLKGSCKDFGVHKLYLSYENEAGKTVKDSSRVSNGLFSFSGYITQPVSVYLYTKPYSESQSLNFFVEPATMQITLPLTKWEDAIITGSATQREMDLYKENLADINKELEPLDARYNAANQAYIKGRKAKLDSAILDSLLIVANELHEQYEPYEERIAKRTFEFFRAHPTSVVSAFNLQFFTGDLSLDTLAMFYNRFGKATQQTTFGKAIATEMAKRKSGSSGSVAKNFSAVDINGQPFSLTALKGKYVLLDFWASWCVPCRKGNPHLKELYAQYKNRGMEVVGISDDDGNQQAWKNAVMKDALPWLQVLRGYSSNRDKAVENSVDIHDLYGIQTLPTQILIDPSGKILGRYGSGGEEHTALDKKLATVFP